MASNLSGVTLTAPISPVSGDIGLSFTMTITPSYSGGGGASAHDIYFEWDQGNGNWEPIPSSGGLYTSDNSSITGKTTTDPESITVYAGANGSFSVRGHGYRASDYYTQELSVTIGAVVHDLTADNLIGASPVLGTPALSNVYELAAAALVSGIPVNESPSISQIYALGATPLPGGIPQMENPALSAVYEFTANSIVSAAPVFEAPELTIVEEFLIVKQADNLLRVNQVSTTLLKVKEL